MQEGMKMKTQIRKLDFIGYLSAAVLLFAGSAVVRADEAQEPRISTSSQGQGVQNGERSHDEMQPLKITGSRDDSTRASGQKNTSASVSQSGLLPPNTDFWIYDAGVELFSDFDRDGYYFGVDLTFDADTVYSVADVYAVVYLSYDFGPWNEYASTDDFTIFGASGDDEYVIETELVSGYVTGDYDILIELYDVYDGTYVASFGPDESSQLSYLPLEDIGRDTPPGTTVVVNNSGGGSMGLLGLLALFGAAGLRRGRRLN
jgi:MYXO-CTERM domain-containing protein